VAWFDNVKDDGQKRTAVVNWRQSPKARKAKKTRDDAETNGDFGASVLLGDMVWPDNVKDDGQGKLLFATGVIPLKREKQKKSSDVAATNGTLMPLFSCVMWPGSTT